MTLNSVSPSRALMVASTKSGTNDIHGSAFLVQETPMPHRRVTPSTQSNRCAAPFEVESIWRLCGRGSHQEQIVLLLLTIKETRQANGVTDKHCDTHIPGSQDLHGRNGHVRFERVPSLRGLPEAAKSMTQLQETPIRERDARAFAGNLIPVGRLSPVAVKLLKLFSAASKTGT